MKLKLHSFEKLLEMQMRGGQTKNVAACLLFKCSPSMKYDED